MSFIHPLLQQQYGFCFPFYQAMSYPFYQPQPVWTPPLQYGQLQPEVVSSYSIERTPTETITETCKQDKKSPVKPAPILKKKNIVQHEKESKNLQKNYAKAITTYISKNKELVQKLLKDDVDEFLNLMKQLKNQLQNVCHLNKYTQNPEFLRTFRILGNYFLKHKSTQYIFNSRILKTHSHLSHRKLIQHSLLRC